MLEVQIEKQPDGRIRVSLAGRLDTQTYEECEKRLQPLLTAATRVLVFDMARLEYLSSMGIRVLLKTTKAMAAHGGKCLLTRLQPQIRAVIDIANALPAQNIFASVQEADDYLDLIQRRVKEKGSSISTLSP